MTIIQFVSAIVSTLLILGTIVAAYWLIQGTRAAGVKSWAVPCVMRWKAGKLWTWKDNIITAIVLFCFYKGFAVYGLSVLIGFAVLVVISSFLIVWFNDYDITPVN